MAVLACGGWEAEVERLGGVGDGDGDEDEEEVR
jgi:hypothetical protein